MQTNVSDFGLPNTRRQSCNHTLSRAGPGRTRLKLYTLFRTEEPKTIPYPAARPRIAHIGEYPPPPGGGGGSQTVRTAQKKFRTGNQTVRTARKKFRTGRTKTFERLGKSLEWVVNGSSKPNDLLLLFVSFNVYYILMYLL